MTDHLRVQLEAKLKAELQVLARRLEVAGYHKLTKADLIEELLALDKGTLKAGLGNRSQEAVDNLAKLLRTTHFGLLAAMLALAVASSISSHVIFQEAVEQAREVDGLEPVLRRDAMVRVGASLEAEASRSLVDVLASIEWEIGDITHTLRWPPTSYTDDSGRTVSLTPSIWIPHGDGALPLSFPPQHGNPATFSELQVVYDFFAAGDRAFVIDSLLLSEARLQLTVDGVVSALPHDGLNHRPASGSASERDQVLLVDPSVVLARGLGTPGYELVLQVNGPASDPHGDPMRGTRVARIPFRPANHPVDLFERAVAPDLQSKLRYARNGRSFARSFRDLADLATGIEALDLESLQSYMRRVQGERGTVVELYGVGIPQRVISLWGCLVLVGVQLFLLLHLSRYYRSLRPDGKESVFWIGLYEGTASAITTHVTFWTAPAVCTLLLARGWQDPSLPVIVRCAVVVLVLISFVLAGCTSSTLQKCRRAWPSP